MMGGPLPTPPAAATPVATGTAWPTGAAVPARDALVVVVRGVPLCGLLAAWAPLPFETDVGAVVDEAVVAEEDEGADILWSCQKANH